MRLTMLMTKMLIEKMAPMKFDDDEDYQELTDNCTLH